MPLVGTDDADPTYDGANSDELQAQPLCLGRRRRMRRDPRYEAAVDLIDVSDCAAYSFRDLSLLQDNSLVRMTQLSEILLSKGSRVGEIDQTFLVEEWAKEAEDRWIGMK